MLRVNREKSLEEPEVKTRNLETISTWTEETWAAERPQTHRQALPVPQDQCFPYSSCNCSCGRNQGSPGRPHTWLQSSPTADGILSLVITHGAHHALTSALPSPLWERALGCNRLDAKCRHLVHSWEGRESKLPGELERTRNQQAACYFLYQQTNQKGGHKEKGGPYYSFIKALPGLQIS